MKKSPKMSRLQGTSCTIMYLHREKGDPVRDKRRCRYFDKGYCTKGLTACSGSSHCKYYSEWAPGEKLGEQRRKIYDQEKQREKRTSSFKNYSPRKISNIIVPYEVGDYVIHSKYDVGIICEIKGAIISIDFNGDIKKFIYPQAFDDGLLQGYKLLSCPLVLGQYVNDKKYGEGYISKIEYTHLSGIYSVQVNFFSEEQLIQRIYPKDFTE